MEESDRKRPRKIISYAEQAEEDDDFVDFKALPNMKSSQENKDDQLKITHISAGDNRETEKEIRQNDREKRHDKEKNRENEKDKKDKNKDRDKHRKDKDRDRHSSRDKDKHSSRDKDRERSSRKDESRREKHDRDSDKYKHGRDHDRKHSNSEKTKREGDKREGSSDYRSETSDSPRLYDSPRTPSASSQDTPRRKNATPRLSIEEKMYHRELEAALAISRIETKGDEIPTLEKGSTTPTKDEMVGVHNTPKSITKRKSPRSQLYGRERNSPSKPLTSSATPHTPKVYKADDLSVSSDLSNFQSTQGLSNSTDFNQATSDNSPVNSIKMVTGDTSEREVLGEVRQGLSNSTEINQVTSDNSDNSPVTSIKTVTGDTSESEVLGVVRLVSNMNPAKSQVNEDPQPSTSGFTGKRQRKSVVFKEDSDSDSFTGFSAEDSDCDLSEGSDFEPSPKKKKKKLKETKKGKKSKSTQSVVAPPKSSSKTAGKKQDHKASAGSSVSVKENTVPSSSTMEVGSSSVTHSLKSTVAPKTKSSSIVQTPPKSVKKVNSQPSKVATSVSNTSPSSLGRGRGAGGGTMPLVKTPFRSPVLLSPSHANNSTVPSRSTPLGVPRSTGLRLGLSRRANVKPLHPGIATKLSD
ncbi:hypothetical protein Pcinc_004180 [Petrolisthes cinctipes]|uniref:RAD51 interacting motif domain-containing protein n=1 Tax=Petrolisthes cinctipes TaxID=88211 RepID=A0AAE1L0E7_PETCI|nr:hypothetical protein Pcinc_004180 [Petrolisthes cinctipes]